MLVIGFLCVSLGKSTVYVLEEYTTEEQRSVVFLWAKGPNANDIHKEMFPGYGRKCLWRKAVADDEEVETDVRKWLRQPLEDLYAAGFDALVKRWDKCINVGGGYVKKYHKFYVLYPSVTYLLTDPVQLAPQMSCTSAI
jgi:hypothetical protein